MSGDQHILVCDDEADVREMLAEYLARRGFRVSPAGNADELRGVVETDPPDLIVLDINMPGEDGLSVLKSLRGGDNLPVVMLTSSSEDRDVQMAYQQHANSYIVKPVNFDNLMEVAAQIELYWCLINHPPG